MKRKTRPNSRKNIFLFLSILAVVAVSGCISNLGFGPQQQTVEAPSDVMSFSDATVIPNPPVLTGDTFTTSFTVKNLDDFEDAKNVNLKLVDWGVCEPSTCKPASGEYSFVKKIGDVSPKDVQQIECQFKVPSSEKIGGMNAKCPIRYQLSYDFSGTTTADLNIISNNKSQDMQRAGQTPSISSVETKSRGPIKVDFSFGIDQPVRTSTIDKTDPSKNNIVKIPMYIRVENKGSGKIGQLIKTVCQKQGVKGNSACESIGGKCLSSNCNGGCADQPAAPGDCGCTAACSLDASVDMSVKIPAALTSSGKTDKCSEITCDGFFTSAAEGIDNCKLTLTKKVEFAKDKSQVFRCELTSPDESVVTDQKTYSIQSEVSYTYQIDNDFNVAIKPMTFG